MYKDLLITHTKRFILFWATKSENGLQTETKTISRLSSRMAVEHGFSE